jgi:hypothetical protein
MSDLLTTSGGFGSLCDELAVGPHGINDLVFDLAPLVIKGGCQRSAPLRPDLTVMSGGKGAE